MPAPTLVSYTQTSWDTTGFTGNSKSTSSVSWNANDILVVVAGVENASTAMSVPTGTGLTFSLVVSYNPGGDSTRCGSGIWTANPGSGSSSAISLNFGTNPINAGFGAFVFRSSAGNGNSAEQHTATKTVSLTPTAADGAIVWGVFDWGAGASPAATPRTPTPFDSRQEAVIGAAYGTVVVDLQDQTSAGSVSYGISGGSGTGPFSIVALEIKAAVSGGTQATTTTPYLGIWSKDSVLACGTFDVGIPIRYGLYDDDFVAQFSGTAFGTATGNTSTLRGLFDRDATLMGMYGTN